MTEIYVVLDGAVQTVAIFESRSAADEYVEAKKRSGLRGASDYIVQRDWIFTTAAEALERDEGWMRGDLLWYERVT